MLRSILLCAGVLCVAALVVKAADSPEAEAGKRGKNMLENPGYEKVCDNGRRVEGWQAMAFSPGSGMSIEPDDGVCRAGRLAVKMSKGHLYASLTGSSGLRQTIPGVNASGKAFVLTVWAKASAANTKVRVYLYGLDSEWGDDYTGAVSPVYDIGTEWQRISHTNSFGRRINGIGVALVREFQSGGGDVWFDDAELTPVTTSEGGVGPGQ